MKRLTIIIMALALAAGFAQAKNWCEGLVGDLNTNSDVDKTVAVSRAPDTHEITNATYDFRFSSSKLYRHIYNTLKSHAHESDYYSESGSRPKNKTIVMRFTDNGRCWSCKLESDSRNKQFLVTVKSDDISGVNIISSGVIEDIQSLTAEGQKKLAEESRRKAAEAKKAAAEGRKAAAKARAEAAKARRHVVEVHSSSSSTSSSATTTIINHNHAEQKVVINNHEQELRQAEIERKKKLGQ